MDDFYLIAEVQEVYGDDGSVIIKSFSDFSDRFYELEKVFFDFFGKIKVLEIDFAGKVENLLILKFRRFNTEEDVRFLIGKKLYISKDNLIKLPEDSYYIHDLLGSDVFIDSVFFGKLIDVLKLPNNDAYSIEKVNGDEVIIPAVKKFIKNFDVEEKILYLSSECKIFDEDEN